MAPRRPKEFRSILEATRAGYDYFDESPASGPVGFRPGSEEKIIAMAERVERGEAIHHEDDENCLPDRYDTHGASDFLPILRATTNGCRHHRPSQQFRNDSEDN